MAGISSAMNLLDKDLEVFILESGNHIGGRMYSLDKPFGQWTIDNGQHVMMGAYHNFLELLDRLGTRHNLNFIDPLRVPFISPGGTMDLLTAKSGMGKLGIFAGIIKMKHLSIRSKILILIPLMRILLGLHPAQSASALDFLKSSLQSKELITRFWEPVIYATLNSAPADCAAELIFSVMKKAFLGSPADSSLIIPAVPLSSLLAPIETYLNDRGGKILFNSRVANVIIKDKKVEALMTENGSLIEADAFIFAIPPDNLLKIIPEDISKIHPFTNLSVYSYSSIISAYFIFDRELTSESFLAIINSDIQWIFNCNKLMKTGTQGQNYLYTVTISGANKFRELSNVEISVLILSELMKIFPAAGRLKPLKSKIIFNRKATVHLNSETMMIRHKSDTAIDNMFLAGDWTKSALPATLESAAISGKHSASLLFDYIKSKP